MNPPPLVFHVCSPDPRAMPDREATQRFGDKPYMLMCFGHHPHDERFTAWLMEAVCCAWGTSDDTAATVLNATVSSSYAALNADDVWQEIIDGVPLAIEATPVTYIDLRGEPFPDSQERSNG